MTGKVFVHIPRTGGTTIASQLAASNGHLPAEAFPARQILSMVRNPYDRAVSICAMHFKAFEYPLTIECFEQWVRDGMATDIVNRGTAWERPFAAPQCCYIRDNRWIWRYEAFSHALTEIGKLLGVALEDISLRATIHAPWQEYYRQANIKKAVAERYAVDFEAFGYEV